LTVRSPANLAVFCSGFGSNFQAVLDAIRKKKLHARVAVMVCDKPNAHALIRAKKSGVPALLFNPKRFRSRGDYEKLIVSVLRNEKVDLIVLAGFMRILTPYFIRAYRDRILNIHPSLLPKFKGAQAIRDAFDAGARETGATVHLVTNRLDSGRILLQKKVKISQKDSLHSLEKKIHKAEHEIYPKAISRRIRQLT
jgi:phosphoribosylglycinamide formyltransferase-1